MQKAVNGKSSVHSAMLAGCLNLHTVLMVQDLSLSQMVRWSHIHMIMFCNLIGLARSPHFKPPSPKMLPGCLFFSAMRAWELGNKAREGREWDHQWDKGVLH